LVLQREARGRNTLQKVVGRKGLSSELREVANGCGWVLHRILHRRRLDMQVCVLQVLPSRYGDTVPEPRCDLMGGERCIGDSSWPLGP